MSATPIAQGASPDDRILTVKDVMNLLQVSQAWIYSPAGRAAVGEGFLIGKHRRYRLSALRKVLKACEEAAQ